MKAIRPTNRLLWISAITVMSVAIIWTLLTVWVMAPAKENITIIGDRSDSLRVLITYDPDPIYNLDEQVCRAVAKALAENDIQVVLATTEAARKIDVHSFRSVVICANTYNWSPDRAVIEFVKNCSDLDNKDVVAITVGSGSTAKAREKFERELELAGANIIFSKEWWLMRPNDESRVKENNVDVAVDQAYDLGLTLSGRLRQ
jgi:flavorubredoxin